MRANLVYTLTEVNDSSSASVSQSIVCPPIMKLEHGISEKVYEQIFGDKLLRRLGRIAWEEELKEINSTECFVLKGTCDAEYVCFDEPQIAKCKQFLSSATFEELRGALSEAPMILPRFCRHTYATSLH